MITSVVAVAAALSISLGFTSFTTNSSEELDQNPKGCWLATDTSHLYTGGLDKSEAVASVVQVRQNPSAWVLVLKNPDITQSTDVLHFENFKPVPTDSAQYNEALEYCLISVGDF